MFGRQGSAFSPKFGINGTAWVWPIPGFGRLRSAFFRGSTFLPGVHRACQQSALGKMASSQGQDDLDKIFRARFFSKCGVPFLPGLGPKLANSLLNRSK